jgi:hypothetical protein
LVTPLLKVLENWNLQPGPFPSSCTWLEQISNSQQLNLFWILWFVLDGIQSFSLSFKAFLHFALLTHSVHTEKVVKNCVWFHELMEWACK